jgi:transposase
MPLRKAAAAGGVRKLLHRMGLSRVQPRPHNPKRDLDAQETFKKTSPRL